MTIEEIQDAFRFELDMILFDPFSGESVSEEYYLEVNKRYGNEMNIACYLAKKEAIDLLEELKAYKELDLEIPQHFTKEQSAWIKKYCIEKNNEFYNNAIDDISSMIKDWCYEEVPTDILLQRLTEIKEWKRIEID